MAEKIYTLNSLGETVDFWNKEVANRLSVQRMVLLFVANDVPDELEPVVKFLNEQMQNIEVLAVEIKQTPAGNATTDQTLENSVVGQAEYGDRRENAPNRCLCGCNGDTMSNFVSGHDRRLDATIVRVEGGEFRADDVDLSYIAERCRDNPELYSPPNLFYKRYSRDDIIRLANRQRDHRQRN